MRRDLFTPRRSWVDPVTSPAVETIRYDRRDLFGVRRIWVTPAGAPPVVEAIRSDRRDLFGVRRAWVNPVFTPPAGTDIRVERRDLFGVRRLYAIPAPYVPPVPGNGGGPFIEYRLQVDGRDVTLEIQGERDMEDLIEIAQILLISGFFDDEY